MDQYVQFKADIFFPLLTLIVCGKDNNSITQCGKVTVKQPSNFEDNLKFTFIPDENDPNAIVEWQQSTLKDKKWTTLPLKSNFFQHFKGGAYTLVLTNSTYQISRHVSYRVHYYNETVHCLMETPNIIFQENEHSGKNSEENVDLSFIRVILLISAVTFVVVTIVFFIRTFRRRKDKDYEQANLLSYKNNLITFSNTEERDKNNGRTKEGVNEERVNGVKVVEEAYEILNDSIPRQMDEQYIQLPSGSYKQ